MSTVIGSVSFVEGLAVAVAPDGTERVLALGDQVMADEVIRTGPDANVEIRVLSGEPVVLAAGQSWLAVEAGMATAGQEAGVGVVSLTSGQVVAVAADGSERVLMAGDVIYADEVIRTSPDGHVDITMRSGNPVTLSGGQSWLATADTYTPADQFDTSEATADVAALQQAILAGQDPTEILEPTAAGETAAGTPDAGNEGADFIQLERTAGETTPEAGYDTIGQGYSLMTPIAEEPILIKQSVAVPVMASDLENNQLVIDEDGSGSFSVTAAAGEVSDFISQIAISNLPTGASVSGSDGGSYDAGTGIYTTSGNPSSVTLTIAGLTPTPDSDVDLGSIGFTATAQDSSDSSLTSSTGTSVSVITDAVLDQYADLSATAQSANESNNGAQTLNLGASMTLASTGWQNDGGDSDGSEHISITLSLNSPLPAGVTLSSSAGTLTPVSGSDTDYTLTAHSGSSLSAAVAGLQATVPQGWDGVISGRLTSVATDTPTGGSDVEPDTSDNSWTDTANFSLTVTGSVTAPEVSTSLTDNQLVIDEDGSGSFSVTAAAGEVSDFISQIAISNLPTGASVSGSDGGSYDAGTGIYTTSGNPSSVTLTIAGLTPTPDSDVDLGSIGFTATAQDSSDSSLTSSTGTSVSVITDAVLDQYADLSATAQSANESNNGAQTLNLGASMTLASTGWQNDGGDSDGSEHISITLSLNSPLPAGVTLSSSAGTLTPVSGSDTDYTLTAHSGSSLSAAVAGLQATVPQGWDGVISGRLTSVATDTPTGGSDVEPDTSDNSWTDTANFSLTVTGSVTPPTASVDVSPDAAGNVVAEDGSIQVDIGAATASATDELTGVTVTLPDGWSAMIGSNTYTGTFNLTASGQSFSETLTVYPGGEDTDMDGSISVVAHAQDSTDTSLTASSGAATGTVVVDTVLDEAVDVTDGHVSENESDSTEVYSLGLDGTVISPYGQTDGAPADSTESGMATLNVSVPTGFTLGTYDGNTFTALSSLTFSGTAAQVAAWVDSLAVQVDAGADTSGLNGGAFEGSISVTFTDTPTADGNPSTANDTYTNGATFSVSVGGGVTPPTASVDVSPDAAGNVVAEDGSIQVDIGAATASATDELTGVTVTLPDGWSAMIGSNTYTGTFNLTASGQSFSETLTVYPGGEDTDVDGSISVVAHAQDSTDTSLTASSGAATGTVVVDTVLDEAVDVTDGHVSENESDSTEVYSLGLDGTVISPYGQTDGAPADSTESGMATLNVSVPTGFTLGTYDGNTFTALSSLTFSGTAAQVAAWVDSLAVQVDAGADTSGLNGGAFEGSISVTFTDTPTADGNPSTANDTYTNGATFSVSVGGGVTPPTASVDVSPDAAGNVVAEDGSIQVDIGAATASATDELTGVTVTLPDGWSAMIGSNTYTGTFNLTASGQSFSETLTVYPGGEDTDVDGSISVVAHAQDSTDTSLTASSGAATGTVVVDTVLDEAVDVTDGHVSENESDSTEVYSLGLDGTVISPYGQTDGAPADSTESGMATLNVSVPTGFTLGTYDGNTFTALSSLTFSGTAAQVAAWVDSLAVQVDAGADTSGLNGGAFEGSISVTFTDTPTADGNPSTANDTYTNGATFSVSVGGGVTPPTASVDVSPDAAGNVVAEDGSIQVDIGAATASATDELTGVTVTLPDGWSAMIGSNTYTGTFNLTASGQSFSETLTVYPGGEDTDMDGSISVVAHAQDSTDTSLTASSGAATGTVVVDTVLDEAVDVTDGHVSENESDSTEVYSLGLDGTVISPYGQTDGAPADSTESGMATLNVSVPTGFTLGTYDGNTFTALSSLTFSGTAAQVAAWVDSLAVQVDAGADTSGLNGGAFEGSISVTFTDTPTADGNPSTANDTYTNGATFSVSVGGGVTPPTASVDVSPDAAGNVVAEDGSIQVDIGAATASATDELTGVTVTLPDGWSAMIGSNTYTGTFNLTASGQSFSETLTVYPGGEDTDVDGSISVVAHAQDSTDTSLTASSGAATGTVVVDTVLDEAVDVTDGHVSENESDSTEVYSLGLDGTVISPYGQTDGAPADSTESGMATLNVSVPTGFTLGTYDGNTFTALSSLTFSGTAAQVAAWVDSLAVQVDAGADTSGLNGGAFEGSISVTFTDTPTADGNPSTANDTYTNGATFSVSVGGGVTPPTASVDVSPDAAGNVVAEDGSIQVDIGAATASATDELTGVTVTLPDGWSAMIGSNTYTGTFNLTASGQSFSETLTVYPGGEDTDVDGSISVVAHAQDSTDTSLTASSGAATGTVVVDTVLDEAVDVTDGHVSENESDSTEVYSLGLDGTVISPYGQTDGAPADSTESGMATLNVSVPTGFTLGTYDGNTFTALSSLTFSGTAAQVAAWVDSLAVQVDAGADTSGLNGGAFEGSISVTFTDTPTADGNPSTANDTYTNGATFSVSVGGGVTPPTASVDVSPDAAGNVVAEDGSIQVDIGAATASATDELTGVTVTLPDGWSAMIGSNTYTGTFNLTASGQSFSETLTVYPGGEDTDMDGSISVVAHAQDSTDTSLTASSGAATGTVVVDTVLDEAVDVTDGHVSENESDSTEVYSLGLDGTVISPYGQTDGAPADSTESGMATLNVSVPTGFTLGTYDGNTFTALSSLTFSGTAAQVAAWVDSLAVQVDAGADTSGLNGGAFEGSISVTFTDTPTADGNPSTANDTYTNGATFSVSVGGGVTPPTASVDVSPDAAGNVVAEDGSIQVDIGAATASATDELTGVTVTLPDGWSAMIGSNTYTGTFNLTASGQSFSETLTVYPGGEDTDVDGSISVVAHAQDSTDTSLTASSGAATGTVVVDTVLDEAVDVTDGHVSENESDSTEVYSLGLDGTVISPYGQTDGAPADSTESGMATLNVSVPTGFTLGTYDGNTFTALSSLTFSGTAAQVAAWVDSLAVQVDAGADTSGLNGGAFEGSISVTFTDTPTADGNPSTANDTYTNGATFSVSVGGGVTPPTASVDVSPDAAGNVVAEDGSIQVDIGAATASATDELTGVTVTLPDGWSAMIGSNTYTGTFNLTASGQSFSETLTVYPGGEDTDVDGSISVVAHAQDSTDTSLTASSGAATGTVVVDTVLDEAVDVTDGHVSENESDSTEVYSLGLDGTVISPYGQTDGAPADSTESGMATLNVSVPTGFTLGTYDGNTFTALSSLTFSGTAAQVAAWVDSLAVQVDAGADTSGLNGGAFEGSISVTFTDTPTADGNPSTANDTYTSDASFSLTVVPNPVLIVGTNVSDDDQSTEPFAVSPDSGSFGAIEGGGAGDILIGDTGGVDTIVVPGTNYNIALIVDVSGSMDAGSGTYENGHELTRLELLQKALVNMAAQLAEHDGTINIALIPFAGANSTRVSLSIQDLNAGNLSQLTDAINALSADGGTNYEAAFNTAVDWFNGSDVDSGATNLTYFLTDGNPTYYLDDNDDQRGTGNTTSAATLQNSVDAFAGLSNVSEVHGIGIGTGINEEYLTFFDNTDLTGTHSVSIGTSSITGPGGEVDVVQTEDELNAALQSGSVDQDLTATGDDLITGNDGDDILFGDSINTDVLADNQGLTTPDGTGWAVFEALENGQGTDSGWNRADTLDYIRDHHAELAVEGQDSSNQGRDGGNDILYGGAGNDILYGQEGDDELYGGAGDDLLNGGSGSDTFVWQNGDQGEGGAVAQDVIQGFDRQGEGDSIDLSDLLQGEDGNDITALLNFVSVTEVGGDTVISVSHDGGAAAGVDQTITLQGVSLADLGVADSNASQAQILDTLVDNGTLTVDQS